ncbi:MAG: hypothetical protein KDA84_25970 [Planctomycetaceae bacterium]|nr:hypothetical protein [Planctomycetaceae bacterium]
MNSPAELSDCPSTDTTHQSWKENTSFAPNLSTHEIPWVRTNLKIPRSDETLFARPELPSAAPLASRNCHLLRHADVNLQGRSLLELRQSARQEILELARNYTGQLLGESDLPKPVEGLLFCSGHQPALFHPGVWVKNFAIHALAKQTQGTALNLVIDNDTIGSRQLRVPTGNREQPASKQIPFDDPQPAGPWEEAVVTNPELFETFGERVVDSLKPWGIDPLIDQIWPDAIAQSQKSPSLRDALTAARMKQEHRWGLSNWELPLSQVCETESFLWFAAAILTRLPRFWETYNTILDEFRVVNHIRSHTRPVPALVEEDGWYEAPFWVWKAGESQRQRVMAKACSREVRLSDGQEIFARLPIDPQGDVTAAVEVLKTLPGQGIRFRTRALTTTLFVRLCLADLFVHGIGGAKYDEMTDRLIARFFGLPAPGFLTMSCTVHLPLGTPFSVSAEEEQDIRHQLRDLEFNPERHLSPGVDAEVNALMAEKQSLIAESRTATKDGSDLTERRRQSRENHERHLRFKEIREQLADHADQPRQLLKQELETIHQHLHANELLQDREFSFAIYPEEKLRLFFESQVTPAT